MRIQAENADYLVCDDFLSPEKFQLFWNFFQDETFTDLHVTRRVKGQRLTDGTCLRGGNYISAKLERPVPGLNEYPSHTGMDLFLETLLGRTDAFERWVGKKSQNWDWLSCTPFIFPVGNGLSWHTVLSGLVRQI